MNLLVTNTRAPQAYAVIRALRPHASRIVATMEEGGRLSARLSHAANSRFVDKRYFVPSVFEDWGAGRVNIENTEREEAFLRAVVHICEKEKIDAIFPSLDPYVYVFSKWKRMFEERGIVIPVPDFTTVLTALDKYRTIQAAQEVGFPCPRTYLCEHPEDLRRIAAEEGFPLVVKPRFTCGGLGMLIARDLPELLSAYPAITAHHGTPMIQEYIPGGQRGSVQFVLDRKGQMIFAFRKKRLRKFRLTARFGTVSESEPPEDHVRDTAQLVAKIGWWGAMGIETMLDPRDGVHKLMEINPRFPRQLWNRTELGINEPWMCMKIARNEGLAPVAGYPLGVLFVSPVEDVMLLGLQIMDLLMYRFRVGIRGIAPVDPLSAPPPLGALLRTFGQTYGSRRRKVWDPYFGHFFQDPLVSVLWWLQFSTWVIGARRHLGK
jgi:biotin carboxylase